MCLFACTHGWVHVCHRAHVGGQKATCQCSLSWLPRSNLDNSAWPTQWVPGEPGLHSKILSREIQSTLSLLRPLTNRNQTKPINWPNKNKVERDLERYSVYTHVQIHHHPNIKTNNDNNPLEDREDASSVPGNQGSLVDQLPRWVYAGGMFLRKVYNLPLFILMLISPPHYLVSIRTLPYDVYSKHHLCQVCVNMPPLFSVLSVKQPANGTMERLVWDNLFLRGGEGREWERWAREELEPWGEMNWTKDMTKS